MQPALVAHGRRVWRHGLGRERARCEKMVLTRPYWLAGPQCLSVSLFTSVNMR
jgi:hypothetical protein